MRVGANLHDVRGATRRYYFYEATQWCLAQINLDFAVITSLHTWGKVSSVNKLGKGSSFERYCRHNEHSKVDNLLGRGLVAHILLWKDEKITFLCFISTVLSFYWFFLCGRALISAVADLLLLLSILIYGHGFLPSNLFGITVKRVPSSSFTVSERSVKGQLLSVTWVWNKWIQVLKVISLERDCNMFFKVVAPLYFLKVVASYSPTTIFFIASVIPFMAFIIYEQQEQEIEEVMGIVLKGKEILVSALRRAKDIMFLRSPSTRVDT